MENCIAAIDKIYAVDTSLKADWGAFREKISILSQSFNDYFFQKSRLIICFSQRKFISGAAVSFPYIVWAACDCCCDLNNASVDVKFWFQQSSNVLIC